MSLPHLIIYLVVLAVWMVPIYSILGRIGWSKAWVLAAVIPPLAIVLIWFIAFGRWNTVDIDKLRDGIR